MKPFRERASDVYSSLGNYFEPLFCRDQDMFEPPYTVVIDIMFERSLTAFMLFATCSGLFAQERSRSDSKEVEKQLNLAYCSDKDADPVRHKLDLYLPKGKKNFPVMMFVHGGSWKSGNKDLYAALGDTFAKQGIGTAIINYRLTQKDNEVKHPDHVKDVAKAFAWLKNNVAKYGGDAARLFVSGHSAGGHLVSLLGTDENYLKAEKCSLSDLRGVMSLSGVYQIIPLPAVFDKPFGMNPDMCKAASPITHVKEKHPPFLIAYADGDFLSLDKMAEDFGGKLKEHKCEAKVMKLEKRNHFSIIINVAANLNDPLGQEMVSFIQKK